MSEQCGGNRQRFAMALTGALAFGLSALAPICATAAPPPLWQTAASNPGNVTYFQPSYPIVFVAARVRANESADKIGTDVLSANNPRGGHELWILLPNGAVKKLFPLAAHAATPGLIDSLPTRLDRGSVVEPNVSEDGRRIYFSYFHDADDKASQTYLPKEGADLYHMNLGPLIDDPTVDPANLPVDRLTTRTNSGPNPQDWANTAMNWGFAHSVSLNNWGTVYMHAVEMRQNGRIKLVYVSDERRMRSANNQGNSYANHNFNLHMADIGDGGALSNRRQLQYYTTTSALSPTPLRNGIAFSYQASTEDARNWQIQALDSAGRWSPLMGYGHNPFLFHLGAFCVDTKDPSVQHPRGDVFLATLYYNQNNEGFGSLWKQDMSRLGLNTYDNVTGGFKVPRQYGSTKLTPAIPDQDEPSPFITASGKFIGKITSPRCGRADELYLAYTPTSANSKVAGNAIYRSYIAYRPNLLSFHPHDPINPATESGLRIVIEETSDTYALVWPVPLLSWLERTGDVKQASAPRTLDPSAPIVPGMPYAQVGTSALYNTDRKPFDCWLPGQPNAYSPNKANNINRQSDLVSNNQDGLTIVADPSQPCLDLDRSRVLGITVNLTSNKPNVRFGFSGTGYETAGGKAPSGPNSLGNRHEISRMLGFYDVRQNGIPGDQSFKALIPSNVPFEFQLIDSVFGLKLTDVRSWHSLQTRETRTDCGGCHQHDKNKAPVPFQGTWAQQNPPLDMVGATPHLDYDKDCNPIVQAGTATASRVLPVWQPDIFPGLDLYCGACHNTSTGDSGSAAQAFGYTEEKEAFDQLKSRNYANTQVGALGSPAFWAARGLRTDGRNNAESKFQKNLTAGEWGYFHTASHSANPGLCSAGDLTKARWVYRLGQWIDNQMPRNIGATGNAETDWYHPTADVAIVSGTCNPTALRVGFWDDSGRLESLTVERNGAQLAFYQHTAQSPLTNGSRMLGGLGLADQDIIRIVAEDAAQNRQMYEKRVSQLIEECPPPPIDEDDDKGEGNEVAG